MTYTASEKLWGIYFQEFENIIKTSNTKIYHYTSPEAFFEILKNKTIWFSNVNCLNDASERKYIYNILQERVYKSELSALFLNEITNLCNMMKEDVENVCYASTMYNINDKFIASFSLNSDSLSLWNYYTKNVNSLGYNIEFNLNNFLQDNEESLLYYLHGKVIYDYKEQSNILDLMLKDYCEEYSKFTTKDEKTHRSFLLSEFIMIIHIFGLFFKHPAYSAEEEYRFILEAPETLNYRQTKGLFIPYTQRYFNENSVTGITISPTQKEELAKTTLENMVKNIGYTNIKVVNSSIPLRY